MFQIIEVTVEYLSKTTFRMGHFWVVFSYFFRNRLKIIKFVNISKSSIPLESILNINLQLKARGIFMGHTTMSKNMVWAFSGRMTHMYSKLSRPKTKNGQNYTILGLIDGGVPLTQIPQHNLYITCLVQTFYGGTLVLWGLW